MKPYWMIGIVFVMMAVFVVAGVTQQTNAQSETLHGNKMNGAVALPTAASVISSLQGKTWRLTSFTNESGSASVLPGTAITAVFGADGKVTGSAGCNNYFAGYQLSGNGIKIGPVGSTLMWCGQPPGVMAQETTYLKLLQGSTTYSTNGTELKLSNGTNANQLIFNASSLQGKTWRLTSFTNESGSASVLPGTAITAVFGADGKVTGSAGCNNYFAGYQLSGNGIKIGPVGSTLMWCGQPPGVMAQETTYLKLLQGSTTYSTNGTELKLSNGTNANQLIFKAPVPCLMS